MSRLEYSTSAKGKPTVWLPEEKPAYMAPGRGFARATPALLPLLVANHPLLHAVEIPSENPCWIRDNRAFTVESLPIGVSVTDALGSGLFFIGFVAFVGPHEFPSFSTG